MEQIQNKTQIAPPLIPAPDQVERWRSYREPLSFDVAAQTIVEAHQNDGIREDLATELQGWAFGSADRETMALMQIPFPGIVPRGPMKLRKHAFRQLCGLANGAPAKYIRTLPQKIQMAALNWGISQRQVDSAGVMLRCAQREVPEIRAIVGGGYAKIDDEYILDELRGFLGRAGYLGDITCRVVVTGMHSVIRLTLPSITVQPRVGEVIEAGLDITNSELGLRSVGVTPITVNLVCLNGMRSTHSGLKRRMDHRGDRTRLKQRLSEAIPIAFAEATGDLECWQKSVGVLIDNALDEIEGLTGFGLSQTDSQDVGKQLLLSSGLESSTSIGELLKGMETSAYDVANAVTAVAQRRSTEGRLGMEEAGYRYLRRRTA